MKQEDLKEILQQYGVGPIQFSGTNDALYERHLTFDHVVDVKKAGVREQFAARWAILCGDSGVATKTGTPFPRKSLFR